MTWPSLLLLSCCGADPFFDPDPDHPWNQLHRVFYSHEFTNGEVYEHEAASDPPWSSWAPFYNNENFHARVVAVLDTFLKQSEDQVEREPPVRRAVLLRDLWPVFDAQTNQYLAASAIAARRQAELRQRLVRIMRRLELSEEEVGQLPDNFHEACNQRLFPTTFDPSSPDVAFLPPDLLDSGGAWVPFTSWKYDIGQHSIGGDSIGAYSHVRHADFRTIFVPSIRVSADRKVTLDFLERPTKPRGEIIPPPNGTMLALVRRAVLPSTSRRLIATPVMESLQLIVVDQRQDHRFKFVLDRAALLKGHGGLRVVTKGEPVDAYAFESGGLWPHVPKKDADGEMLPFGGLPTGVPSLGHCADCHGRTVEGRLFANTGRRGRAEPTTFETQVRLITSQKENSFSWGMYQALRD